MSVEYKRYSQCLERSVKHIFTHLFNDNSIDEIYESTALKGGVTVMLEIDGTLKGALKILLPAKTLKTIAKKMDPDETDRSIQEKSEDIAGEMANQIAGTFANQLQFIQHSIRLYPPEFGADLVGLTTFYENINMIFSSAYGVFMIDLFYKDNR